MNHLHTVFAAPGVQVSALVRRCQYLERLNRSLAEFLPAPLAPHVRVAHYDGARLLLHTDSAAWATQLRFLKTQLLREWPRYLKDLQVPQYLDVRVRPWQLPTPPLSLEAGPHLSAASAQLLESLAASVQHPPLQRALQRLAANTSRQQPPPSA